MISLFPAAATPIEFADLFSALRHLSPPQGARALEERLCAKLGMRHGRAFSSLMRTTWAVADSVRRRSPTGSRILLPRYSCPSFIHGIKAAGVPFDYVDTDPETLCVGPEHLEKHAYEGVGALLVPNLFGLSADMPSLAEYCKRRNWLLLEGADYSLGGRMRGRELGAFGDYCILNFQEGKALPISGGMALSKDLPMEAGQGGDHEAGFKAAARSLAYSALIRPLPYGLFCRALAASRVSKKLFSMEDTIRETTAEYDFVIDAGKLARGISDFQGSLGCVLLDRMSAHAEIRAENAARLEEKLRPLAGLSLVRRLPGLEFCHYIRYPILVGAGRCGPLCRHLISHGFEASRMYIEHGMSVDPERFPGAFRIANELLTLPCHPFMRPSDIERLADLIASFLEHDHVS